MGNHVSICYAREDAQFVLTFTQQLKDRGVPVWLDRWDIPAGANWTNSIDNAIQGCAKFLIVLSPEAVQSEEVQGEWHTALDDHKPIVPVLLRNCRIPPRLRVFQYVDFTASAPDDVIALGQVVRVLSGASSPSLPPDLTPPQPDPPPSKSTLRVATDEEIRQFDPKVRQVFEAAAKAPAPASYRAPSASRFSLMLVILAVLLLVGAALAVYMYRPQPAPLTAEGQRQPAPPTPSVVEESPAKEKYTTVVGKMVEIPAGDFFMGCNEKVDNECDSDEKPGKAISLPAFSIDKIEVTVAQFAQCVKAGKCSDKGLTMPYYNDKEQPEFAWACNWGKASREDHPINCVDWDQARAFCSWAGKRLPTETEWEKAARGTDGRKYPWGNKGYDEAGKVANIADETAKKSQPTWNIAQGYDDGFYGTAPVGSFPAGSSPYGALDMIGNVWEWTADWYDKEQKYRSVRGGSWYNLPQYARASVRLGDGPGSRGGSLGVRCAQ